MTSTSTYHLAGPTPTSRNPAHACPCATAAQHRTCFAQPRHAASPPAQPHLHFSFLLPGNVNDNHFNNRLNEATRVLAGTAECPLRPSCCQHHSLHIAQLAVVSSVAMHVCHPRMGTNRVPMATATPNSFPGVSSPTPAGSLTRQHPSASVSSQWAGCRGVAAHSRVITLGVHTQGLGEIEARPPPD